MPPTSEDQDRQLSLKLIVVLSKAYKSIMERAAKDIRRYDLSPSEFGILEVLYAKGKVPLQQIGSKLLLTSGTTTYNIDKLEKKGLLNRLPCEEDRRVTYGELTDKGKQLFDHIFPQHAACIHDMMSGLTEAEKETAIELLKKMSKGADQS